MASYTAEPYQGEFAVIRHQNGRKSALYSKLTFKQAERIAGRLNRSQQLLSNKPLGRSGESKFQRLAK